MEQYFKAFLYSFMLATFLFIFGIPFLRVIKAGQSIRKEGPSSHLHKAGTPTMGGIIITIAASSIFIIMDVFVKKAELSPQFLVLLLMPLILYGVLGFIDDYLIVVKKNNNGISAKLKLLFQIIWASIYFFLYLNLGLSTKVNLFGLVIELKWSYGLIILLMFVATSNAVNLTDGLDGLASGLMIIALFAVVILAYYLKENSIILFSLAIIGGVLAFLCYNYNPAKVIMGNTGSLALGASLANFFILLKMEVLLIIIGFIFVIETLSVIIQVLYFKLSKGKRVFLMAPLHHHFELKGYNEVQIDLMFWLVGLIFAVVGVLIGVNLYV